ncbi:mitochondrial carrier protein [Nitzschia inconspicua]|uniref:Mitochondrial carrier protein n=1 Tax=Nitzschia inconspicua TaxID=303405 RepID=A0A9K3LBN8_9STRA|nr:mitochondrial carrier protein [Nitzschia inconspicua]
METASSTTTTTTTATASSSSMESSMKRPTTTIVQQSGQAASDMTRRMVCGGLAGCIAKTATNPLERIKMLSQTGEHTSKSGSVVSLYRAILRNEGVVGLWAGNGANLLRIFPAKAVVFSSNDAFQGMFRRITHTPDHQKLHHTYAFLSGGMAGVCATVVTYPLDFARGRISGKLANTATSKKEYRGILHTVVLTVRDEGFLALYKGVTPTLLGALPYEGIKFGTVGLMEKLFPLSSSSQQDENESSSSSSSNKSTPLRKMVFGGMGGVMAGLLTYPNDTVRRLLQLQGSRGTTTNYNGYIDCVVQTYRKEGIPRFYRGVTINIVRMAPNAAVQFGSYEFLKQLSETYL